jgi:hypothetical protein
MPALSPVKEESVGLGGSRMSTKARLQKREDRVHGSVRKKLKHTVIQKYFFLKAGRVN